MSLGASLPAVCFKMDPLMKQRLQPLAKARHRTAHGVLREAIEPYVARQENAKLCAKTFCQHGRKTNKH